MGKSHNYQAKHKAKLRREAQEEEKLRLTEEQKEREAQEYWAIGAKDTTKEEMKNEKKKERLARRAHKRELYESEMGDHVAFE